MPVFRAAMPTSWKKAWSQAASFQRAVAKATSLMAVGLRVDPGDQPVLEGRPAPVVPGRHEVRIDQGGDGRVRLDGDGQVPEAVVEAPVDDRAPASSRTFFRSPGSSRYLFSNAAMAPGMSPSALRAPPGLIGPGGGGWANATSQTARTPTRGRRNRLIIVAPYGFSFAISPRIRFFWSSSSVIESAFS